MKKDGSSATALLIPSTSKGNTKEMAVSSSSSNARLKTLSLVVLIVQTTALVLVLRYSRTQKVSGPKYISSTAVLVSEAVKVVTCFIVLFKECNFRLPVLMSAIDRDVIKRPADFFKMSVPAVLYVVQNNLLFLALSKLDAATYQVTYQLKILTTAFFTVVIMQRTLLRTQWAALILLTAGVALVQWPSGDSSKPEVAHDASDHFVGLMAVIAACLTSGFAGVFLEKILKQGSIGLWMRNLQLAFFSIFGGVFMCWFYDGEAIERDGLLQGYNGMVWTVVGLQAYGGLIIALVVKYADNILKGFAVSLSIILSSFVSWFFLSDFSPSMAFVAGGSLVIGSTFLYGYEPKKPSAMHSS